MKFGFFLLALAATLSAAPAIAAPSEDAACITARVSAEGARAIADSLVSEAEDDAPIVHHLAEPLRICIEEQGWSENRAHRAFDYATAILGRAVFGERLGAQGIESGVLDRWFGRQSGEFRTNAFTSMTEETRNAALATLLEHDLTVEQMYRNATIIGGYIATLVVMERAATGMSLE